MDWLVPTFHPAHILRGNARFQGIFKHDLARAIGLAHKTWAPQWVNEKEVIHVFPKVSTVEEILRTMHDRRVTFDVETNGAHQLVCDLRCVAFYDGRNALCVPLLYRDGTVTEVMQPGKQKAVRKKNWKPYFSGDPAKKVHAAVQRLVKSAAKYAPPGDVAAITNPAGTVFESQNGQFDRMVMKHRAHVQWHCEEPIVFPASLPPHFDGMIGHHVFASYMPHNLGFFGSLYTDAPFYKATEGGDSWASESDEELYTYCARDVVVTWQVVERIRQELLERREAGDAPADFRKRPQ